MMSLQEVIELVDRLSPEERTKLRAYLDRGDTDIVKLKAGTMNVDVLLDAAQSIRAGMSEADFDKMLEAMNEEYIELVDEDEWLQ